LIDIFSILFLIFWGILADENVKYENFNEVYTFGLRYNYNFLLYFAITILTLTLILQIFLAGKLVQVFIRKKQS